MEGVGPQNFDPSSCIWAIFWYATRSCWLGSRGCTGTAESSTCPVRGVSLWPLVSGGVFWS